MKSSIPVALCFAPSLPDDGDAMPKRFAGVAYSGGTIPSYGLLGDVAIDLSTLKIPNKALFALVNHDKNRRAGVLNPSNDGSQIAVTGEFLQTASGQEVASEFSQGAPWELSVMVTGRITRFPQPTAQTVNGRELMLDALLRDATIREVSFVPVGADPNTHVVAFSVEDDMTDDTQPVETPEVPVDNVPVDADEAEVLKAELKAMTDRCATLEQSNESLRADLINLHREVEAFRRAERLGKVRASFEMMGRDFDDAKAEPYLTMDATAFAIWQRDIEGLTTPRVDATLTAEVATAGADPTDPLQKIVAELKAADPHLTHEMAIARALHAHPELYVSL